MAAHQVNVYFWLIDTIASGRLTREDINRRWAHCRYNDNHDTEFQDTRHPALQSDKRRHRVCGKAAPVEMLLKAAKAKGQGMAEILPSCP